MAGEEGDGASQLAALFRTAPPEERAARERAETEHTPAGRARRAYARGDQVFQYSEAVVSDEAEYPLAVLNGVCAEGWDLLSGQFVFMGADRGTVGYYLFRRRRE